MNDRDATRDVRVFFAETAPSRGPEDLLDHVFLSTSRRRQRPRWLALMKEPPMRLSSGLAVGSPTARLAAIAVATLLLALMATGAVIGAATLLAGPAVIVVAQDGSGAHTTITAGVDAAQDGDTVLVRPGTYVEAVVIERDITLTGDGPREEIVITAPEDGPTSPTGVAAYLSSGDEPYAILLVDSEAVLSGFTLHGSRSEVHARGGAPTLEDLSFDDVGSTYGREGGSTTAGGNAVVITHGSRANVRSNILVGGGAIGIFEGSDPTIEGNTLNDGPHVWGNPGQEAVIRGNTISGTLEHGIALYGPMPVGALIEGNTIRPARGRGILVGYASSTGVDPVIRRNVISGGTDGISSAGFDARPTIEENVISGTRNGIFVASGKAETVARNELSGNEIGIVIAEDVPVEGNVVRGNELVGILVTGGAPTLAGNTIQDNGAGIRIGAGASPSLSGNTICGNETSFELAEGVSMPDTTGNDICPDGAAEPAG